MLNQIDEMMKKYVNIYNKNFERFSVSCVLKLLTTTNRVRYIKNNTKLNLEYFFDFSILSRINQYRYNFPHICEMRITFSSYFRGMTYDYYIKQPLPMCEVRLNQIIAKNPRLIYRLNRFSSYPYTRKYTNQKIIFVNERN